MSTLKWSKIPSEEVKIKSHLDILRLLGGVYVSKIVMGIDPDCDKSGVAVYVEYEELFEFAPVTRIFCLFNLRFWELVHSFYHIKGETTENVPVEVVVECGFLNKGNWHLIKGSGAYSATIGARVGANHEAARKIVEVVEGFGFNLRKVKPTKSKVDNEFFCKVTGYKGRTNQEQRDAGMLIASYIKK